jgi:chromate transporter
MAASALIVARAADTNWTAVILTLAVAAVAFSTRLNPLWLLLAGGLLGLVGLI